MRQIVYQLVRHFDLVGRMLITILSAATNLIGLKKLCSQVETVGKKEVWIYVLVVSLFVFASFFWSVCLTEVPDVIGHTYENATRIIADAGLKYELFSNDGLYVVKQSIAPGTIVNRWTQIDLTVEEISASDKVISEFEKKIGAEYGTLSINLHEIEVLFKDERGTVAYFGPQINNAKILDAYLYQEEYCVKYSDYTIENEVLAFKRIPIGIEFKLNVLADGYEEVSGKKISISSEHINDGVYQLRFGLIKRNEELGLASSFRVADENGNFLENVDLQIKWEHEDMWYGYYRTDRDGCLEYMIWLEHDQVADVCVVNPFGNGIDYCCKVNLHKYISGDMVDNDIIIISKNGDCHVTKESEYFGY